ncbi:TRAP transporter substrate-binding protein DctP [Microbacterium sp. NPDC089696]|uniref:TRAP transporter substrate-binding protein n=1 Tax=Microbacterium sp. NPDC089696 TaxID=3364199 RepID=UPI0037F9FFB1
MSSHSIRALAVLGTAAALTLTGCAASGGGTSSNDETVVLKVAFNQPESHPEAQAILELGEKLSEATDGRYEIDLYTDELLGAQAETIELVQSGSIAMTLVGASLLENFNPDFGVISLPYLYESKEHQMAALNDPEISGDLFTSIADQSLQVLVAYHGGVRNVYTKDRPVETPEDLAGLKIRVSGAESHVRMMELMGGVGTPMAQGEVYTAIQSGVLDGAENAELVYAGLGHAEVAPYYSYTEHLMIPDVLVINPRILDDMSDADRETFLGLVGQSVETEVSLFDDSVTEARETAEAAGATFVTPDLDEFRDAVRPLIDEIVTTDSARALYDSIDAAR